PVSSKSACLFAKFGITATDKENPDVIVSNYNCVIDSYQEVYKNGIVTGKNYYEFPSDSFPYPNRVTGNGECAAKDDNSCSCNFVNEDRKIFLGNVSYHYCKNLDFINFAKANVLIDNIKGGGNAFTLHLWVFALSYVDKVFQGVSIEWKGFVTIKVGLDPSGNYYFTCLINNKETKKYVDFQMNEWNFLHCSVDYDNSKFYIASENKAYEYGFTYDNKPTLTKTDLIFTDLNTVRDWGILFYKHIRIWNIALKYSSFLSRIKIQQASYFGSGGLIDQWDTTLKKTHAYQYLQYNNKNADKKNVRVYYDTDKIGTNIVNEKIYLDNYKDPYTCSEYGEYYDRKTKGCIKFFDISDATKDIVLTSIDLSYNHNYGIAFWIFLENKNMEKPIDFIWQYHMRISLQYVGSSFKAYCFPQNYEPYSKILDDETISLDDRVKEVLNSATNEYTNDLGGEWTCFQCLL
ncbi:MAG: hypothetical protein J6O41_08615, partial [Clostridia bacterium]|nr:hypothetical protein [Clostridia bacterium]